MSKASGLLAITSAMIAEPSGRFGPDFICGLRTAMLAAPLLAGVLLGGARASAEEITPLAQGANVRTGTIQATITVTFATAPLAGSTVSCNLTVISNDAHLPSENAFTTVTVSGNQAICSMPVNYRWQLANGASAMTIAYSVSGPSQSSAATFIKIAMPAGGAVTTVAIAVSQ